MEPIPIPPAKKKSSRLGWIITGIVAVGVIVVAASGNSNSSNNTQSSGLVSPSAQTAAQYQQVPQPSAQPVVQVQQNDNLSNNNSYVNSDGNTIHSPAYSNTVPVGASARCGDGTYSFSQHRSGTCSHHGGVASWL